MTQFGIGQQVRRVDNRRFITGHRRHLDEIARPRQAHATIRGIDVKTAAAARRQAA